MEQSEKEKRIREAKQKIASLPLFSEDTATREMAIAALPENDRERTRIFVRGSVDSFRLISIMLSDLGRASGELHKNYNDQFWRRTAIRTLCAAVEGTIYTLKQMAHSSAEFYGISVSSDDNKFLLERKALAPGERPKFLPFKDNLKHTFNVYAKYCSNSKHLVSFADDGCLALYETFSIRDLTMHPKSYETFSITTQQTKRAGDAILWFHTAINLLVAGHNSELENRIYDHFDKQP